MIDHKKLAAQHKPGQCADVTDTVKRLAVSETMSADLNRGSVCREFERVDAPWGHGVFYDVMYDPEYEGPYREESPTYFFMNQEITFFSAPCGERFAVVFYAGTPRAQAYMLNAAVVTKDCFNKHVISAMVNGIDPAMWSAVPCEWTFNSAGDPCRPSPIGDVVARESERGVAWYLEVGPERHIWASPHAIGCGDLRYTTLRTALATFDAAVAIGAVGWRLVQDVESWIPFSTLDTPGYALDHYGFADELHGKAGLFCTVDDIDIIKG